MSNPVKPGPVVWNEAGHELGLLQTLWKPPQPANSYHNYRVKLPHHVDDLMLPRQIVHHHTEVTWYISVPQHYILGLVQQ